MSQIFQAVDVLSNFESVARKVDTHLPVLLDICASIEL